MYIGFLSIVKFQVFEKMKLPFLIKRKYPTATKLSEGSVYSLLTESGPFDILSILWAGNFSFGGGFNFRLGT